MQRLALLLVYLTAYGSLMADNYERFEENGKVGLKDNTGKIILPASFEALGWSDGNFSVVGQITGYRKDDRWGLLNLKKEFITGAEYQTLTYPGGDRVIVSKFINSFTLKFGCLDLKGHVVVSFSYDDLQIHELRALVMVKNGVHYEYGLIDLTDKSILPLRYKKIAPIGSLRYSVQNFSDKTAICSEEGKWFTDFVIDDISDFQFDLAVIRKEWRHGVIDRNGQIKVEPLYREVKIAGPGLVMVRKANQWKRIDDIHNDLHHMEADELISVAPGWNAFTVRNKSGFVDEKFQPCWSAEYDFLGPIRNNQIVVKKNGKFGLLRLDQSVVLPLEFDSLCVQENFIRARQTLAGESFWHVYDTFGIKKTATRYESIDPFNGKFFPVKNHGYYGGVDRYGKERIACVYDSLLQIQGEWCVVSFRGQYGVISLDDQWRLMPQKNPVRLLTGDRILERQGLLLFLKDMQGNLYYFSDHPLEIFPDHLLERLPDGTEKEINFLGQIVNRKEPVVNARELVADGSQPAFRESEGLTGIRRDGKFGFVDGRGRLRIANRYDAIGEFRGGLAPVKLLGKWGYISTSDQIVIQPTYDSVEPFNQNVAQVARSGKAGLINREGKVLLELRYDSIERLPCLSAGAPDCLLLLTSNSLKGLADDQGRVLIEPRFDSLEDLGNGRVIVKQNNRYGLLTTDGLSIFPLQYDQLLYLPRENVFVAQQKFDWETVTVR